MVQLSELQSAPIVLPQNSIQTLNGKDTLIDNLWNAELKFIVYMDSIRCATCEIGRLSAWNPIISYSELFDNKFKIYFILNPQIKDFKIIRTSLLSSRINYPILIDENGDFEKLNPHLPKNKQLHAFLLDKDNNVVLVGNPLTNQKVEKLFYKTTQNLLKEI